VARSFWFVPVRIRPARQPGQAWISSSEAMMDPPVLLEGVELDAGVVLLVAPPLWW